MFTPGMFLFSVSFRPIVEYRSGSHAFQTRPPGLPQALPRIQVGLASMNFRPDFFDGPSIRLAVAPQPLPLWKPDPGAGVRVVASTGGK